MRSSPIDALVVDFALTAVISLSAGASAVIPHSPGLHPRRSYSPLPWWPRCSDD
jgi:hypothetical protein